MRSVGLLERCACTRRSMQLNLVGWLINSESQGKPKAIREPILITKSGILIFGFPDWHAAVSAGQTEVDCTEFELNDDEALQLILSLHRPRAAWNDFTRTELAFEQEPYFQSKALANQIAGGKHKGLANLPKAQHIDVREKIADLAGVSPRTVGNVKIIVKKAHPQLVEALHNGTITINRALQLCQDSRRASRWRSWHVSLGTIKQQDEPRIHRQTSPGKLSADMRDFSNQAAATRSDKARLRRGTSRYTRKDSDCHGEAPFERPRAKLRPAIQS